MSEQIDNLKVIIPDFIDVEDNRYKYKLLESYPRAGYEPSKERVKALATGQNKADKVIIAHVLEEKDFEDIEDDKLGGATDYEEMNKGQLQEILKERNVEFKAKDTKEDLLQLLEGE